MKKHLFLLLLTLGLSCLARCETVIVPGEVNSLCYYDNFFYNLPEHDFLFYFNDTLLYTEPPDDSIYSEGMREKYLKLLRRHRQIKEFIVARGSGKNLSITLDLKNGLGLDQAIKFFALLGLQLRKTPAGALTIVPQSEDQALPYYAFCHLKASSLQTQINQTGTFFFKLQESPVPLPWDFAFLKAVSGLPLNADTFFEQMIANKRFSFLLAILFRLSANEIDFIGQAEPNAPLLAWKKVYADKKLQMGMLVLSSALRVRDGALFFPGGDKAKRFWSAMAGCDPDRAPFTFLAQLSGQDQGKLNYLYVFSFFLPEESRRVLFFDYDPAKVRRLYQKIFLDENEKIRANAFPRLENASYYFLLQVLEVQDGRLFLPLGVDAWVQATGLGLPSGADECDFLESLLAASAAGGRKKSLLQKFISVYAKFSGRGQFLSREFLGRAFTEFESKSTLLDFLEKIPLKKSENVNALFAWQEALLRLNQKDRLLFTALGQSLLETIAQAAAFAPAQGDFDKTIRALLEIPWSRPEFYDGVFAFLKEQGGERSLREVSDDSLFRFLASGLDNQDVSIRGERYEWRVRDLYRSQLSEMMRSQEVCSLSTLSEINALLRDLAQDPGGFNGRSGRRLGELFEQLPYPDFSGEAPKSLKDRVLAYGRDDLGRDVRRLLKLCEENANGQEIQKTLAAIKSEYLLPLLKDYFLALAYAVNAKSPKLKVFLNPNLIRLHDFSDNDGSPWNRNSGPGNKAEFSGYYLKGGLSRLNLTFALNWRNQLFEKNIFNSEQTQALLYNIMSMLPQTTATHCGRFDALLVEYAVESLSKCSGNGKIKAALQDASLTVAAGYHYRGLDDFLAGRAKDYYLFFSELRQIGLNLAENGQLLNDFSQKQNLGAFLQAPLRSAVDAEGGAWGNVYYNSMGSLMTRANRFFPQEPAQLLATGWFSGESISEYKIKAAYLALKNDYPPCLIGPFVFDFVNTVCKPVFAQNHVKDYHSTYFVLDVMNSAHLKNTVKKLQQEGFLRLQ